MDNLFTVSNRLSPAQRNMLHRLELEGFIDDMDLSAVERKTLCALQRKDRVLKDYDDDGYGFWAVQTPRCKTGEINYVRSQ